LYDSPSVSTAFFFLETIEFVLIHGPASQYTWWREMRPSIVRQAPQACCKGTI